MVWGVRRGGGCLRGKWQVVPRSVRSGHLDVQNPMHWARRRQRLTELRERVGLPSSFSTLVARASRLSKLPRGISPRYEISVHSGEVLQLHQHHFSCTRNQIEMGLEQPLR